MPRVRDLPPDVQDEIDAAREEREVIRLYRSMLGRELGDRHLRERGILPAE